MRVQDSPLAGRKQTETETTTAVLPSLARPWNVVVHDDPITLMVYVTQVFMEVFGYPEPRAHELMLEVHQTGRAIVWTGGREPAETYVQKLIGRHLRATLETADA